jgi:Ca2+-binding RTX toxin-like protein
MSDLLVYGTAGNDTILFNPAQQGVTVKINGTVVGTYQPTARILVYGQAGDDDIQAAGGVSLPVWLFGGDGNDRLKGGDGTNVLVGGAGDDLLVGGSGRDLIIGGDGADKIVGNAEDDLLIAGRTAFDADQAALAAVMAEWTSTANYADRLAHLQGSVGGANGSYFLVTDGPGATVTDDGLKDVLTGDLGRDWFFANLDFGVKDKITYLSANEFASDLDFILGL